MQPGQTVAIALKQASDVAQLTTDIRGSRNRGDLSLFFEPMGRPVRHPA